MATTKKKLGRKTRYNPRMHPRRAAELVGQGLTDKELAEAFGIGEATLYRWQDQFREFRESIKKAKEKPNRDVEAALFKRAIGFECNEITASGETNPDGSQKVIKIVKKLVPADPTCMIFWLKNRMPKEWRDAYQVHMFNREEGLEGIDPENEALVAERINDILGIPRGKGDGGNGR